VERTKGFDEALARALLAGDTEEINRALELIEDHLRGPLCGWLHRKLPGLPLDEVTGAWTQALVDVLRAARAGRFDATRPLLPWLQQIAYARAVDAMRRASSREHRREATARALNPSRVGRSWLVLDPVERCEMLQLIEQAVATFPPRQQLVYRTFAAHYPESCNPKLLRREVALASRRVETPVAVKRTLQRVLAKLQCILRRNGYDPWQ
jgi:DNA-directed RNA polymerase specialized sigma24 family protein